MVDFFVRFAALISFITLISGRSLQSPALLIMEIAMIAIWFIQDFKHLKRFFIK